MTANRWWVRLYARWQARIDASLQEINLGLRMISSGGIGSAALAYLGQQWLVPLFLISIFVGVFAYSYLTFEGGVKNQVAKDRNDMINNFSSPANFIDDVLIGVSVFSAVHGREPTEEELETITETVRNQWEEYRDGIELDQSEVTE